jgi:hypothetical protein
VDTGCDDEFSSFAQRIFCSSWTPDLLCRRQSDRVALEILRFCLFASWIFESGGLYYLFFGFESLDALSYR